MSSSDIDINRLFNEETMPKYYATFAPHFPVMFPGRDLVANPLKIMDVIKEYVIPATTKWKFTIDAAQANQDVTDDYINEVIKDYAPNALYFDGQFRFKNEDDMTHARMKYF